MLSKQQIKVIKSLSQKKYRQQLGCFVVEGIKSITEFLNSSYQLQTLYTTKAVFNTENSKTILVTEAELKKISNLKSPNKALAIFKIPEQQPKDYKGLIVALDAVNDPGNLGTIIRLCDWFGVAHLVCSQNTVDCYNPKVVQATMGSLTRVAVSYVDLESYLKQYNQPIFGTFMQGKTIYKATLPKQGVIVLGNEANGISEPISKLVDSKISIPQFGSHQKTESLNVANATAIVLSEFLRRSL